MKLLCLMLLFFAANVHAEVPADAQARVDSNTFEKKSERESATAFLADCYGGLNQEQKERLSGSPGYMNEFVDLQIAKAREYMSSRWDLSDTKLKGNQKRDMLFLFVYDTFKTLLEDTDFPVAKADTKNKDAALNVLMKACEVTSKCTVDRAAVSGMLCGGDQDWRSSQSNTVHNVFRQTISSTIVRDVLTDQDTRLSSAPDEEKLEKRWNRITEILKGNRPEYTGDILKDTCIDADMPEDSSTRVVYEKLTELANEIGGMSASNCYSGSPPSSDGASSQETAPEERIGTGAGEGPKSVGPRK